MTTTSNPHRWQRLCDERHHSQKLQAPYQPRCNQPLDGYEGSSIYLSRVNFFPTPSPPPGPPLPSPLPTTFTVANSIGQLNNATATKLGGQYTLWQPHFDRDFSSVMELLSIPLYGPGTQTPALTFPGAVSATLTPAGALTQSLAPRDIPTANLSTLAIEVPSLLPPTPSGPGSPAYIPLVAQAKFFRPQYPQGANPPQGLVSLPNAQVDNRWHRILEA